MRYNVQRPDGTWSQFDTIKNDYICAWRDYIEFEFWRRLEYGIHYRPLCRCTKMEYDVAEMRAHPFSYAEGIKKISGAC